MEKKKINKTYSNIFFFFTCHEIKANSSYINPSGHYYYVKNILKYRHTKIKMY